VKRASLTIFLLIFFVVTLDVTAKSSKLDKVKIISAEQLDYKDGNSVLIGNVKIQLGEFMIEAPQVYIDSDKEGKAEKARFENGVVLDSEKLSIQAPRMELDVESSVLKCFANDETLVQTDIYGKKQASILANYQEIDLGKGFARASANPALLENGISEAEQLRFVSEDVNIRANTMELEFKDGKDIQYVDFLTNVVALTDNQRIESQELLYFPELEMMKAYDEVKVLHLDSNASSYLFADALIYEKPKHVLSVFSRGVERYAEIHSANIYGKARQILVNIAEDDSIENAILTGNAYAQHKDKSIVAYEILFDAKKKQLETIVGRPHTQLLKIEKEELKTSSSKKPKKTKTKKTP
jgi:lipopolysaccharide export system protein LptA